MKSYKIFIILFSLFILIATGCEEKVLDKEPRTTFSEKDVWKDMSLIKKFVASTYNGLGNWGIGFQTWNGSQALPGTGTDMAYANWDWGQRILNKGNISPESMEPWGSSWSNIWPEKYEYIRKCNIFLTRIGDVEADQAEKDVLKGEVKYLRARYYYDLIRYFGGVPLITEVFELDDEFMTPRTPYEEIVGWIVKELDEARKLVPEQRSADNWGKVNKGACLALKSNLLLYANSKLHDPGTDPSGPLYDYTKDTWQQVLDAAKAVIDMPQYSLQQVDDWEDYNEIFLGPNSEIIFAKPYHPEYGAIYERLEYVNNSNGFNGWGNNVPIQNLVDAFEMDNGKMINEAGSGYDPSPETIYENRDPRFYADILYQGSEYRGRDMEYYLPGGLDSKDGPEPWNASKTGYNLRKFLDESLEFKVDRGDTPWIYLRLAEMYLNCAEAHYNMGNEAQARQYLNTIRNRVNMPDVNTSGEALFRDIQHERRIELCFEHHRFFDVRRWMIADSTDSEDAIGITWKKVDQNGELDPEGELTYEYHTTQERFFYDRMYYLPIPISEINKSDMKQNVGY
jgi:hypothetical protein